MRPCTPRPSWNRHARRTSRVPRDCPTRSCLDLMRVLGRSLSQVAENAARAAAETGARAGHERARAGQPLCAGRRARSIRWSTRCWRACSRCTSNTPRRAPSSQSSRRSGGKLPGSREVSVCFADLVGFTRLGEEVPPDELGRLAARLEALAGDVAEPPVRPGQDDRRCGDAGVAAARAAARRGAATDRRRRCRGPGLPAAARRRGDGSGAATRRRLVRAAGQPGKPHHVGRQAGQPARRARAARVRRRRLPLVVRRRAAPARQSAAPCRCFARGGRTDSPRRRPEPQPATRSSTSAGASKLACTASTSSLSSSESIRRSKRAGVALIDGHERRRAVGHLGAVHLHAGLLERVGARL